MSKAKLGKIHDDKTKEAISIANGTPVYLYKITPEPENFTGAEREKEKLILEKTVHSVREAGKFLKISHSTVSKYLKSGALFKIILKICSTKLND